MNEKLFIYFLFVFVFYNLWKNNKKLIVKGVDIDMYKQNETKTKQKRNETNMEYLKQENIVSWKHIDIKTTGVVEERCKITNVYLVICSSGNRYYLELLGKGGAHIYPYNDCYSNLTELKIVWSVWKDIPIEDQEEFERESKERKWKIWNKNNHWKNSTRRLLHLFLDV